MVLSLKGSRWEGWFWALPLLAVIGPVLLAVSLTCQVPKADHWFVVGYPYLGFLQDGSFGNFLHSPGNDSRHDAARILHWLVVRLTDWNLVVESLVCVGLGLVSCAMVLSLWRRSHPGSWGTRWLLGGFSVVLLLSPMQWMNWTWGVQICYMLVIAASVGVVWVFERGWPLWLRTLVAGGFAVVAAFSFINGWLAWGLGGVLLFWELIKRRGRGGEGWTALGLWGLMFGVTLWVFVSGWPEEKALSGSESGMSMEKAEKVVVFFVRLLGAPFAEGWPTLDRELRSQLVFALSSVVGVFSLVLLLVVGWKLWAKLRRGEVEVGQMGPWLLLCGWGLANAAAISLARVDSPGFLPFQSRYPAYTLWFYIGLFGLLAMVMTGPGSRWLRWVGRGWFLFLVWGWGVGAVQGWRDGVKDARSCGLLEASVSLRQVVVEPLLLDSVDPGSGLRIGKALDELDAAGVLSVATVRSSLVAEATMAPEGMFQGKLVKGELEGSGVSIEGWAMEKASRDAARSVVISIEQAGVPERWLGIVTRRKREAKVAKKVDARAMEDRIGWAYVPMTGEERVAVSGAKLTLQRAPLPSGEATFRAYAFDPRTGVFSRLDGSVTLPLP